MTRVLLTGAGGFAGHHCLEHLLATTDWDVVATDSFRHKGKTDRIREVLDNEPAHVCACIGTCEAVGYCGPKPWRKRTEVIMHDLGAPFSRQSFIDMAGRDGIDYVIAYASDSHVNRSIADPIPFVLNNVGIALSTMELCRELEPKAVVWISTDEVYGPQPAGEPPFPEWSSMLPSNPYAASKAAQEALCIAYWRTYGVPVIIVNAMNMIGERQDPEKFVPMVTRKVMNGETVIIHGTPTDIGTRHYLHSRNLADGIVFLLKNSLPAAFPDSRRPSRFNVASPDRIDNLALAQLIADTVGKPLRYEFESPTLTRPGHDPHYGLDPRKIGNLGWKAPVPFRESLERTVRWTIDHPAWLED